MNTREKIIAASVIVLALVSAVGIGTTMASTANTSTMGPAEIVTPTQSDSGESTTEAPQTTTAVVTTSGDSAEGPQIDISASYEGDELDEGDTGTLEATVTDADGNPVEGATVTFMSLGYNVEFTDGPSATTNGDGVVTKEFLLDIPTTSFDKNSMPPVRSLTMIGQSNVNDAKAEGLLEFPVRPNCEECHGEGEYE